MSRRHPQKDRVVYFYLFIITKNTKLNKGEKGIYQQQQNKDSNSFIRLFFFPVHCCLCKTHRMGWLSYFSSCCPFGCFCCFVPQAPVGTKVPEEITVVNLNLPVKISSGNLIHNKYVRVVLISDTHGRHEELGELPDGDILIHCGDFVPNYKRCTVVNIEKFDAWLGTQSDKFKHTYVCCGNHEVLLDNGGTATPSVTLKNAKWLDGSKVIEVCNLKIWGAPYRPRRGCAYRAEAFGRSLKFIKNFWEENLESNLDVVITHGPPYGVLDLEPVGHIGDWYLLDQIANYAKPSLHAFGHVHHCYGGRKYKNTLFVNASSCSGDRVVHGLNKPVVVDLFPKKLMSNVVAKMEEIEVDGV